MDIVIVEKFGIVFIFYFFVVRFYIVLFSYFFSWLSLFVEIRVLIVCQLDSENNVKINWGKKICFVSTYS